MKLWIIETGGFDSDQSVLTPHLPEGVRLTIPVYAYLIQTPESLLWFDTGCSDQCRLDPIGLLGSETVPLLTPRLRAEDHIRSRIEALGFQLSDIDAIVNSHAHFDHAGGNEAFPNHRFYFQREEWEAASNDSDTYPDPAYRPHPGAQIAFFDGDTTILPGVNVIFTPGHTRGHQSLMVELSQGPILITSDAVYTQQHFDPDFPGASADPILAADSVRRLQQLAQDGARPFFSHDPYQRAREGWKIAPDFYQ